MTMDIKSLYTHPEQYKITELTGGYLGGARKVTVLENDEQFILKPMGKTDAQISHSLILLKHIKGLGKYLANMTRLVDWSIHDGELMALFEYIENTENRHANITEMLQISNLAFLASKKYDHTKVSKEIDFERTVLYEINNNGVDRYSQKYFQPFVDDRTQDLVGWMSRWADYFINNLEFKNQYLQNAGFIHRDIHRHNIIIKQGEPYLIDFDFSGVDCRLIEITRPTNVYIDIEDFLPMVARANEINRPYFTAVEEDIFDRVLVLDMMANLGWEVYEAHNASEGGYKKEILAFLNNRLSLLGTLMNHRDEFNLGFV